MLAKGLNFAITPDKFLHDDYILMGELIVSEIIMEANRQVKAGASTDLLAKAQKRDKWITSGHI